MEIAKYPLAYALLLCLAVSAGSRSYGYGGGQYQIRGDDDVQGRWCIAKPSAYNFELLRNLDYSCGQDGVECTQIQPGGSCFRPDTAFGHASYSGPVLWCLYLSPVMPGELETRRAFIFISSLNNFWLKDPKL